MKHFTLRHQNNLRYFVCEPLEKLGFVNAFSTRLVDDEMPANEFTLGHSDPAHQAQIAANRLRFKTAVGGANWTLVTARQVHSADIRTIKNLEEATSEPQTGDALAANLPEILLGIQTADCLPILFVDERTRAFAGVHAGWRGTVQEIAALTIARMQTEFGARAEDIHAALGPAICAENFEVGAEVLEEFRRKFAFAEKLFSRFQSNGKAHIDLNQCNVEQLLQAGLRREKIYVAELCTIARNDLFFSYRKERGHERYVGRLMSVVGRRE